jgi:hypothetical protein
LENNLVRPKKPKINKPFNPEALFVDLSPKTMVINDGSQWNSLGHLKKKKQVFGSYPTDSDLIGLDAAWRGGTFERSLGNSDVYKRLRSTALETFSLCAIRTSDIIVCGSIVCRSKKLEIT